MSSFSDDTIAYVENLVELLEELLELVSKFSKVVGCRYTKANCGIYIYQL